ncbi:hypothetical protein BJY52DRAFT_1144878 [Lactarius psammicola]|nr:hypothetical protein BJY52DRAFT_1144878 [Lactarius psammicola]
MFAHSLTPLLSAIAGFAAPSRIKCSSQVPASSLNLPPNQKQLVAPTDAPDFVTVGVENQNYTCAECPGAVAQVFDITSLYLGFEFSQIQEDTYSDWLNFPINDPYDPDLAQQLEDKFGVTLYGQHYFIETDEVLSPVWDFRPNGLTPGNSEAIVIMRVTEDIPAPTGRLVVDWLEPEGVTGKPARTIFRVYTKAGEQLLSESCEPGFPGYGQIYRTVFELWI